MSTPEKIDDGTAVAGTAEEVEVSPKTITVDTTHNDEGLKVITNYIGDREWSEEEEAALLHKIDWKLMPILCLTFGLQFYDKTVLAQAAIFGLIPDLDLGVGVRYSFSSAIFYLGFIAGAYPIILLAQRYPVHRVIFIDVLLWGICLMTTIACHNYRDLYAQRFFLGFLEAGVSPAWIMIVAGWYNKREQSFRMGVWYSASAFTSIFSPLINYGLGHIKGSLSPWRYMYIVAAALTIAWSLVILFFLEPEPIHARALTDRERYIAIARLRHNNAGVRNSHFKWSQVLELLLDLKFWIAFIICFCAYTINGPVGTFFPIIITQMGFSGLNALLLTMPAGLFIGMSILGCTWAAGKYPGKRLLLVAATICTSVLAAALLWKLPDSALGGKLFALYILPAFVGGYGVLMGVQVANTAGYTKRSLSSAGVFMGYSLGNIAGPMVFISKEAPGYITGWATVVSVGSLAVILCFVYIGICVYENRRRDTTGILEGFDHAYEDDLTDKKNPQFRYCY